MKNIQDYIGKKVAIHTPTQEEFDAIRALYPSIDLLKPEHWNEFKSETCIFLDKGRFLYESLQFAKDFNNEIIPALEFLQEQELIGWVWKEGYMEKYLMAFCEIIGHTLTEVVLKHNISVYGWHFMENSLYAKSLKEAGVLEIWFNPVYKQQKQYPPAGTPCLFWDNISVTTVQYGISQGNGKFKNTSDIEFTAKNFIPIQPINPNDKLPTI